ncbi:MAG: endonuclease III [Gammaproteobacteria bacterium]
MPQRKVRAMFARLRAAAPAPASELRVASVFELLISVMLSAQATDVSVNRATEKLYRAANTPQGMLGLGLRRLKAHIKTIGLYNTKAKNILATCKLLLERHGGEVPGERDALVALPGVGRKTANVVLNTAFGQPTIAVDTHVFRVSNRTRIAPGKNVAEVERGLLRAVPDEFKQHAHHWLILLGRHTCTARKPNCAKCLLRDLCPSARLS